MTVRESWDVVLQDDLGNEEHETVFSNQPLPVGLVLETTDGQRITFVAPSVETGEFRFANGAA